MNGEPANLHMAWWSSGDCRCGCCEEHYLYETEVRCADCDRGICPTCVVYVREESIYLCPECEATQRPGQ